MRDRLMYHEGRFLGVETDRGTFEVGIEFGTTRTFFSSQNPERCQLDAFRETIDEQGPDRLRRTLCVHIPGAGVEIAEDLQLAPGQLQRRLEFRMTEDSWLMDMVSRYAANDSSRAPAMIGGEAVAHVRRNRYVHCDVPQATIPFGRAAELRVEREHDLATPGRFRRLLYVRDEPSDTETNRWVLHHRVLVDTPQKLVLRGCSPLLNRPLPSAINCLVPRPIRRSLYMVRESWWPGSPVMTVGAAELKAGSVVTFRDKVSW